MRRQGSHGEGWAHIARGRAKLLYVSCGTAASCGVDLQLVLDAVYAASLRKGRGQLWAGGELLKPSGWQSANMEATSNRRPGR